MAVLTAAAINGDAITAAKIADNAFTNDHFAAGALTSTEVTSVGDVTLADGAHGGSSASFAFGAGATISNASGHGLEISSTGGNGIGLKVSGNGTGSGMDATGGATAHGIRARGGATSGDGIYAHGTTLGNGIRAWGADGDGIKALGDTNGNAISATKAGTGSDINLEGDGKITGTDPVITADMFAVSGDSAAADRLELFSEYQSYQDRRVHVDVLGGAAGTTDHENGTLLNPSSVWADAISIAASLNIDGYHMHPGSGITLTQDHANNIFHGDSWSIVTAGFDLSNSYVYDAFVNGDESTSDTQNANFTRCLIWSHTAGSGVFRDCAIANDFTLGESSGSYTFVDCFEASGQTQSSIDFDSLGNTQVQMDRYSGVIELKNMAAGDVLNFYGNGGIIINANCAGGTINRMAGNFDVTDNASGNVTVTNEVARYASDLVGVAAWAVTATELTAAPAQNATFRDKFEWLFGLGKNKLTETATTLTVMKDDGSTPMSTSTVSDSAGTTTRGEFSE